MAGSPSHRRRTEAINREHALQVLRMRIEEFSNYSGEKNDKKKVRRQLKALSKIADAQRSLAKCG
jgi:hypothetical protein